MNPMNILVATDYSPAVSAAEHYAIQLARSTQSTLRFLHVFRSRLLGSNLSPDPGSSESDPYRYQYDHLSQYVSHLFKAMHISPGDMHCKCSVREGNNIARHVMLEADDAQADLIVTGTHGATVLREWVLGSNTWNMIRSTEVPLLAVPENAVFAGVKRLLFATEYRESEIPAIHYLGSLAREFGAELTVLHITGSVLSRQLEDRLFHSFREQVKSRVSYDKLTIRLIHHDDIIEGLNQYCDLHSMNWLVMSPARLSWLDRWLNPADPSTTKHMSFHTRTPLLILPDFYNTLYADMMKRF